MQALSGSTPRDQNHVPATYGVSSADGVTAVPIEVNPSTGRLLVDSTGSASSSDVNLAQVGGASIALGNTTMASSLPVTIASNQSSIPVTLASTTLTSVTPGTGATNLGASVNSARSTTKTGVIGLTVKQGAPTSLVSTDGNYAEMQTDASGRLWVNGSTVTQPVQDSAAEASLATVATNTTNLSVSQASTTSGQSGILAQAAVTSSAPSYTTAQTAPLSLTTGGNLRTTIVGNATVVGAAASGANKSGNPVQVGAVFNTTQPTVTTGQAVEAQATSRGSIIVATGIDSFTVQPGNTANTTPWLTTAAQVYSIGGAQRSLNTYAVHLTSNTTTTPVAATAYVSSIVISSEVAGTTSTITIQDKSVTPLKLINGFSTTTLTTTPTTINLQTPILMTSGIDIITSGAVAATVDIWINYFQ